MSARVFVDTNVLIYAKDRTSPTKQKAAQTWMKRLWESRTGVVSQQSLREYYNGATKAKVSAPRDDVRREVMALHAWLPSDGGMDRLIDAWKIQDRYQLAFFDAMLLAAARAARCTHFLSEDMHDGLDIGGTLIVNFLTTSPEDVLKN